MPRLETVLQVFVASPADVTDEREILETVIVELNRTWSGALGVRLDLQRWESAVHPAIGSDPQSVINSQIGDDYDIFIGVLWGRLGTPTPRSESGTLEEFERAYSRWMKNPDAIEIMLYFKDAAIRPSEADGRQLYKVQEFKRELGERGGLHLTFDGLENFESLVRAHLSKVALRWGKRESVFSDTEVPKRGSSKSSFSDMESELSESDDDLGFLDYLDRYNFSIDQMTTGVHAVADATTAIGEQMNRRAAEMMELGDIDDPQHYKDARRTIRASAEDMIRFADILDGQLPLLASSRKEAFQSLSKALVLSRDFGNYGHSGAEDVGHTLDAMVKGASEALASMSGLRQSVRDLPRLTADINNAKRRVMKALDQFAVEVENIINTANNLLESL